MQRILRPFSGNALQARALRGSMLTVLQFGSSQVLRLASNLILTRLLFPEAFGLMALTQVFLVGLQMFSDFGINASVIRSKRGDDPVFLHTAWTVQILRGCTLWLACVALAGPAAAFYDEPMLRELMPVVGLTAVIQGFASFNLFTANRKLILGRLTFLELGTQTFGIVVMVVAALLLESVWALVIGGICASMLKAILSHIVLDGPRARFALDRSAFWELFHFGKWILLSTVAGFLLKHGDRAILGKYIALDELAFYNIAFMLATLAYTLKTTLVTRVLYPLYCKVIPVERAPDRAKVQRARWLLTGGCFAASLPFIVFGQDLVELLYDPRYHQAGPMVVGIGVVWLFRILTAGHDPVLLATGRSRDFAILLVFSAVLRTALMLVGAVNYGVPGVIGAALAAEILIYPVLVAVVRRYGAWSGRHDAVFAALALVILALALWHRPDAWDSFLALARPS